MKAINLAWLAMPGVLAMVYLAPAAHGEPDSGACCLSDGTCEECSEFVCDLVGGVYEGDGTDCETTLCEGWGACCFADYGCEDLTASDCDALGGAYQGDGTVCGPATCPSLAACCFDDGLCALLTDAECAAAGGSFLGAQTDCSTVDCLGACCFYSGSCLDALSREQCESLNGLFKGHGSECVTVDCSTAVQQQTYSFDQRKRPTRVEFEFDRFEETGRRELRQVVVEFTGAVYAGVRLKNLGESGIPTGVTVNEYLVGELPTLDDPSPVIEVVDEVIYCGDENYLLPPGQSCDYGGLLSWPDDPPASLTLVVDDPAELSEFLGEGTFQIVLEAAGSFTYGGTDFELTNDPHRVEGAIKLTYQYDWLGACCYYDGSCQLLTKPECDADAYSFGDDSWSVSWSKGLYCDEVVCPVLGACCLESGCVETTLESCESEGGQYQGDGTDCDTAICPGIPWGACCFEDSSCDDGLVQSECDAAGGIFMGFGTYCAFVDCPWLEEGPKLPWSADLSGDGAVAADDMILLFEAWGEDGGPADLNDDGRVDAADMSLLLAHWGPCPPPPEAAGMSRR